MCQAKQYVSVEWCLVKFALVSSSADRNLRYICTEPQKPAANPNGATRSYERYADTCESLPVQQMKISIDGYTKLLLTGPISLLSGPSASLAARGTRSIGAKRRPISTTHMRFDTRRTRIVSATSCLERASSPSGCDPREASRLDAPRQTKRDPSGGYIPKSPPSPPCPGPDGPLWHRRPSFPSLAL